MGLLRNDIKTSYSGQSRNPAILSIGKQSGFRVKPGMTAKNSVLQQRLIGENRC